MEVGRSRSLSVSHVEATDGVTRMRLAISRMETTGSGARRRSLADTGNRETKILFIYVFFIVYCLRECILSKIRGKV